MLNWTHGLGHVWHTKQNYRDALRRFPEALWSLVRVIQIVESKSSSAASNSVQRSDLGFASRNRPAAEFIRIFETMTCRRPRKVKNIKTWDHWKSERTLFLKCLLHKAGIWEVPNQTGQTIGIYSSFLLPESVTKDQGVKPDPTEDALGSRKDQLKGVPAHSRTGTGWKGSSLVPIMCSHGRHRGTCHNLLSFWFKRVQSSLS